MPASPRRHADPAKGRGGGGAAAPDVDVDVMRAVAKGGRIADSHEFAGGLGVPHPVVDGVLASLSSAEYLKRSLHERSGWALTAEGQRYLAEGSPEAQLFALVSKGPIDQKEAEKALTTEVVNLGLKQCMQRRVLTAEEARPGASGEMLAKEAFYAAAGAAAAKEPPKPAKGAAEGDAAAAKHAAWKKADEAWKAAKEKGRTTLAAAAGAAFADTVVDQLRAVQGGNTDAKLVDALKKRKLAAQEKVKYWTVEKGPSFPDPFPAQPPWPWKQKQATDVTQDMLKEIWANPGKEIPTLKPVNFDASGKTPEGGHLHPLMKLRQEYREIFLEMGFKEMETNRFVDSSFWNFDTLFVPQKHPARDAQDTFFISDPERTKDHPDDFVQETKEVHEGKGDGKYGSCGYKYEWSKDETERNVLRTHTTAISSYTLWEIGQKYKRTGKLDTGAYFSIDRVFRNEEMDKSHLCEFHQIEGFMLDYNLSLSHMMAVLGNFFKKTGVEGLRFKPTYNPYTEPSMEMYGYSPQMGKVIELGNSGVFRPEMLRPMGLPENATAIAWGLGLERGACMFYKLSSVHDLFGHRCSLPFIKSAPMPRI